MKKEKTFSQGGAYTAILKSNVSGNREAVSYFRKVMADFIAQRGKAPIRVLDLACGGIPQTIANVMSALPDTEFEYTGIDINADQVRCARDEFEYPRNVSRVSIHEGDAWDLNTVSLDDEYDVIFCGFNFHHGTPEEIYYVALHMHDILTDGGMVLNHDSYRPVGFAYLRRCDSNPNDPSESYRMVSEEALAAIDIPDFEIEESQVEPDSKDDWRNEFFRVYEAFLLESGVPKEEVDETLAHIHQRDFPISRAEAEKVFSSAGFEVEISDVCDKTHLLVNNMALVVLRKA